MWTASLLLVHESLFGQRLAWGQFNPLATFAFNGNLWITAEVLTHIENERPTPNPSQRKGSGNDGILDRIALHDLDGFGNLFPQYTLWSFLYDYR